MRVALAMIPLLSGCSEPDPDFAVSQWFDGVETTGSLSESLHTDSASSAPGLWARSMAQARSGESSWHFGDGTTYPVLTSAWLETPAFEAGRQSFLSFSVWTDVPTLSPSTATDGLIVEGQIDGGEWVHLEPAGGYPYVIDQIVLASPLYINKGAFAGTEREWIDTWVEMPEAEPGAMVQFRFRFGTDIDATNNMGEGAYVDDVEFLIVE